MHTLEELIDVYSENYDELARTAIMIVKHREHAEDLMQELALKIMENPEQFAKAKTVVAYYKTCLANAARTRFKREKRVTLAEPEMLAEYYGWYHDMRLEHSEWMTDLENFLSTYPKHIRTAFKMRYLYGYQVDEIAAVLGVNRNALNQQFFRMRKKLAAQLPVVMMMLNLLMQTR